MEKIQQFNVDGVLYSMPSTYYQEEKVWHSDISPYEWHSESEMRKDMMIHFLSHDDDMNIIFENCVDESDVIELYNKIKSRI